MDPGCEQMHIHLFFHCGAKKPRLLISGLITLEKLHFQIGEEMYIHHFQFATFKENICILHYHEN